MSAEASSATTFPGLQQPPLATEKSPTTLAVSASEPAKPVLPETPGLATPSSFKGAEQAEVIASAHDNTAESDSTVRNTFASGTNERAHVVTTPSLNEISYRTPPTLAEEQESVGPKCTTPLPGIRKASRTAPPTEKLVPTPESAVPSSKQTIRGSRSAVTPKSGTSSSLWDRDKSDHRWSHQCGPSQLPVDENDTANSEHDVFGMGGPEGSSLPIFSEEDFLKDL